jgi:carbamoyltransferase
MNILGLSAFYHDSAASLLVDGNIIAAAQEERFTRLKHDASFPKNSINFCLEKANLKKSQIDYVVYYEKPFLKFERLIETYLNFAPLGFKSFKKVIPLWTKDKLFQKKKLIDCLNEDASSEKWQDKLLFSEHHMSHAASAFYPSPFHEAIILTMDGVGEWATTSVSHGVGNKINIIKEINFPHSIGLLYSAFTSLLGFKVNSGEYKVMGLAPYGQPTYFNLIMDELVDLKDDGSYRLNLKYFDYSIGFKMINKNFNDLFKMTTRDPQELLTQKHMDIAASIQKAIETIILKMTNSLYEEFKIENLCLAGGVALNCVANSKILKQNKFKNLWIQPASGDAGGSLGAALCGHYQFLNSKRSVNTKDSMKGSLLGPSFSNQQILMELNASEAEFIEYSEIELVEKVSKDLQDGKTIGWFQGAMEFGPRALGNRSILADPRNPKMQKNLNLKIKYRESFRPFAPAILENKTDDWFDLKLISPYMLLTTELKAAKQIAMSPADHELFGIEKLNIQRSLVPSITHVDYSARVQTVNKEINPLFYKLIEKFEEATDCPLLINTSFNVRGEPIVCTPSDAYRCFMGTELDVLVIGNFYLIKEKQKNNPNANYKDLFVKD